MNKSRIPSFLFFCLLFLLTQFRSNAQVTPNKAGLQKASQERTTQDAAFRKTLTKMALDKGWPLTLRGKKGRLAYLRGINSSGLPYYVTTTDNIISAATIGTNKIWPNGGAGLSLNGGSANMKGKIAVWDEGKVRATHVELAGRVIQQDNAPTLSDHSTHVSGTLIAKGVNPLAKGMSYGAAQLNAYDFTNDQGEMMGAAAGGLLVSSHSYADIAGWFFDDTNGHWEFWGNPNDTVDIRFGLYDEDTRYWDTIAYLAPNYLIAKAAGNNRGIENEIPQVGETYYRRNDRGDWVAGSRPADISDNNGYNTIATFGCSKNILTIGAVNPIPGGYTNPSDVVLADFSSLGPTGDGRIKPDLVADGVNVLSSISTADNAYDIYSGTSMATPASAGSSFLLQEYYSQLHSGAFLTSAALKGLLVHTADEAGPTAGPDYAYGWGLINMERAAAAITADHADQSQRIIQDDLGQAAAATATYTITASGKSPVSATLCWTDIPGPVALIPANARNFKDIGAKLVNDLDLRITDNTTHKVYLPWILNPVNPGAAASKGDNILDNVEKVELLDSLIPGRVYTVTVSHKRTLSGAQAFALLLSGGGGQAVCPSASTVGSTGANITSVRLGGINNPTASGTCRSYTDFSTLTAAQLPVGMNVPVTVVTGNCGATDNSRIVSVYIDFNNNGIFETNELAAQSIPATQASTFNGAITVPSTAVTGTYARMRIIVKETSDPAAISPCGTNYGAGETQDYRVMFVHPTHDVGVTGLAYPTQTTCASDSQIVSVRIHNFGTVAQAGGIPVTTTITGGPGSITPLTAICKDSIPAGGEVVFTYNTSITIVGGNTYTYTSKTALNGDLNTANDGNTSSVVVSSEEAAGGGKATLCGTNPTSVALQTPASGVDVPVWYSSATGGTPIAAGNSTTADVITSDKTYYMGLNDLNAKAAPANRMAFASTNNTQGAYFRMGGNFTMFTTSVPLTIESAKMYIGHSGQITFTLANLISLDNTTREFSYLPLYTTTIDVYATKAVPDPSAQVNVSVGDNTDTGATYLLNIPIPTPGNYIIIVDCANNASAFLNTNIKNDPYPISLPGIISFTGNNQRDWGKADSVTYSHQFYFPFYNMGIRLAGCPSPRTAVVATPTESPAITFDGTVFTSNRDDGNQWYVNDSLMEGHIGKMETPSIPGVYYTVVNDPETGCALTSNKIVYTPNGSDPNASIGLKTTPNPSSGVFQLQFYMNTTDNTSVTLTNVLGQKVYEAQYPGFSGFFSQQINGGNLASGVYTLQIQHGGKTYHKELLVVKK